MNMQIIIFSKDRALQLRAVLDSLKMYCSDLDRAFIRVLYKTSDSRHENQYLQLNQIYKDVTFIAETDFQAQLTALIADAPYLMFLVDDNIFYKPFTLSEVISALEGQTGAIGFSLRLGSNTSYCHTRDESQSIPEMVAVNDRIQQIVWQNGECDFGYPLELSSSVYNAPHILALLSSIHFSNPNTLEAELSKMTESMIFFEWLLFFNISVTFCNPLNRVQNVYENPIAQESIDAEALADYFDQGKIIDVAAYSHEKPNAAHFEVPLRMISVSEIEFQKKGKQHPLISVIIPVYNGAQFLAEAVASIGSQSYDKIEVIIVNDGSTDNSSQVANELSMQFPKLNITVINKNNEGLAAARNEGISKAGGAWILPLDCDDCFAPGFLSSAVEVINDYPEINLIFANMQEFGERNNQWIPKEYSLHTLLEYDTFPYASLYRRELWVSAGGYNPSMPWGAEDWAFWLSCSVFGIRAYRIEECMFKYRVHPEGSMYTRMMKRWDLVKSLLRTTQPTLYPVSVLIQDHEDIAGMESETIERIEEISLKHIEQFIPYFWKGLVHEKAGRLAEAAGEYFRAISLASYKEWQIHFRLCIVNIRLGRMKAALENARSVILRRPELAQIFKGLPGIDLQKMIPLNLAQVSKLSH